jgi:hypothetical protein
MKSCFSWRSAGLAYHLGNYIGILDRALRAVREEVREVSTATHPKSEFLSL